jgi:hypothetical protein
MYMSKVKITVENDLGEVTSTKSYELGSDFGNMDKLETAISSVSSTMLTDITSTLLLMEEEAFLKKTPTSSMGAMK